VLAHPVKSWNLRMGFSRWKVMENDCGLGKLWKSHGTFSRRIIILGVFNY